MSDLTAERLRELVHYDPETGVFTSRRYRDLTRGEWKVIGTLSERGYVLISIGRLHYRAHRLAWLYMTGAWPLDQIDHIDGIRDNNRWVNLRAATHAENQRNKRMRKDKKIPLKGVAWSVRDRRFYAIICVDGKYRYGPHRRAAEEAHADYAALAAEHFGEYARAA